MEELWAHGEEVRCVHPGWPPLLGWSQVRQSWQTIFSNTESIRFELTDVQVVTAGELAWVFLTENITSGDSGPASVAATNLFQRQGGRWRLVLHHASAYRPSAEDEDESDDEPEREPPDPSELN
jgi:ketosteroid isomerase-like protein